jgi:hypothetical protein
MREATDHRSSLAFSPQASIKGYFSSFTTTVLVFTEYLTPPAVVNQRSISLAAGLFARLHCYGFYTSEPLVIPSSFMSEAIVRGSDVTTNRYLGINSDCAARAEHAITNLWLRRHMFL